MTSDNINRLQSCLMRAHEQLASINFSRLDELPARAGMAQGHLDGAMLELRELMATMEREAIHSPCACSSRVAVTAGEE